MTTKNWVTHFENSVQEVFNIIGDNKRESRGDNIITKHSARDGQLLYQFGAGTPAEVAEAVAAAKAAFDDGRWSRLSVHQRAAALQKLADLVEANKEELALNEALDVGKPISEALSADVGATVSTLRSAAEGASKIAGLAAQDGGVFSCKLLKPIGVCGAIVGWNYPMSLASQKIGPALAMGNTLVLKPSEFSSLSAWRLAELALEAGIPDGVFNVVNGAGAIVGDALARHPDVRLLSFTGSSATGKRLQAAAGESNMKRLILECGGKSPYIVFDDYEADLNALAKNMVSNAFENQGALCVSPSRVLLQSGVKDRLLPKLFEQTKAIEPNDPLDPNTTFGGIINEAHMKKVLGYVQSGHTDGAQLLTGGEQIRQETGGYYLTPAIFDNVKPTARIAKEEIFGPLMSVFTFDTEEEAVALANDSEYGLAAYAATGNAGRMQRLARDLDVGVAILLSTLDQAPGGIGFGAEPHKQSGMGVEGGLDGLMAYTARSQVLMYF